jgi:hypothetical protein
MRHGKWRIALTALTVLACIGLAIPAAHATQQEVCGNGGTGYCMNDWNGVSDGPVKMYNGGNTNEDFYASDYYDCNNDGPSDVVQAEEDGNPSNCPFSTTSLDNEYQGDTIIFVQYGGYSNECVGGTGNYADLISCGSDGTVYILLGNQEGCSGDYLVNRYFSDLNGQGVSESLLSGGSKGAPIYNDISLDDSTCWGGL